MHRGWTMGGIALWAALTGWATVAGASPPWSRMIAFRSVEADPQKQYVLGEQHGPWMILACSFSGEGARQQADELALELRKRYKLEAYTYKLRFDFGEQRGRGVDRFGAPLRMRRLNGVDGIEEIAVLVGNYPTVDDPQAQRDLQTLKYAQPECLDVSAGERTNQSLAGLRSALRRLHEDIGSDKKKRGPMGHAFVTTNPLLPQDRLQPGVVDELVLEMNRDAQYSLLDCPGRYTVQVATFKGNMVIKHSEIEAIERGGRMQSRLAEAAMNAHKLTEALRLKGWEAYEFHDRYASIVTVGSFNSVGSPRADGRIEINPRIHVIMQTFGAEPVDLPGQATGAWTLKSFVGLPFDIQPIPVEVPRRSIGAALGGARQAAAPELWR
jgi:hypothetical protein